jgi:hypothetical protein
MKKLLAVCLPLAALAIPTPAQAWFRLPSVELRFYGHNAVLGFGPNTLQASPWYNYWPYEAHFQTAAPTGFPYWPAPQTTAPGFNPYASDYGAPALAPQYFAPSPAQGYVPPAPTPVPEYGAPPAVQPTGYYYQPNGYAGQVPSYWYQR